VARVPADEDHGEVHGAHGEHQVEETEAVGDVVLLRLPLRLLELRVCLFVRAIRFSAQTFRYDQLVQSSAEMRVESTHLDALGVDSRREGRRHDDDDGDHKALPERDTHTSCQSHGDSSD